MRNFIHHRLHARLDVSPAPADQGEAIEETRTKAARTHFDRWSRTYEHDRSSRALGAIQRRALAKLELGPADVFLDVACGTGAAVRAAAAVAGRAVGFDVSSGMIEQARKRAVGAGNLAFVEGDASKRLPFADGEFTAVLCTTALHHFPRQREAIAEFARVLAPHGCLVIADANRRHPAVFVADLVLRRTQRSHVGFRSSAWIVRRLRRSGLHDVSVERAWRGSYVFIRAEKPSSRSLPALARSVIRRAPRDHS